MTPQQPSSEAENNDNNNNKKKEKEDEGKKKKKIPVLTFWNAAIVPISSHLILLYLWNAYR